MQTGVPSKLGSSKLGEPLAVIIRANELAGKTANCKLQQCDQGCKTLGTLSTLRLYKSSCRLHLPIGQHKQVQGFKTLSLLCSVRPLLQREAVL